MITMGEESEKVTVVFTVQAAEIDEDENILLVGNTNELGKWCLYKGIVLDRVSTNSRYNCQLNVFISYIVLLGF